MRGVKPLPSAVKEASGAYAKNPQRRNDREPQPAKGAPAIPDSVTQDPIALEHWRQISSQLDQMRVLTQADQFILEIHCMSYASWYRLKTAVPYKDTTAEHKHQALMLKTLTELGLTPSARTRLRAEEDTSNPFYDYLRSLEN